MRLVALVAAALAACGDNIEIPADAPIDAEPDGPLPFALVVTPDALAFPGVTAGTTSAPQALTIREQHGRRLGVVTYELSPATAGFAVSADTCATAGDATSCTLEVRFAPAASGAATATLFVRGVGDQRAVALTGDAP